MSPDPETVPAPEWRIAPEEVESTLAYLRAHFPGGTARVLTEASDEGQLFQVVDREGTRYTLKVRRAVLDDLRRHRVPWAQFLDKQGVARRLRHGGRLTVLRPRGEDMFREALV
jgi:hypothetical protein